MKLPLWRVADFTQAAGDFDREQIATGYSIDSRTIKPGELFFAVRGERMDGHDFVNDALARGAVGAVVQKLRTHNIQNRGKLLLVEDPLVALQTLGAAVRRLWNKPVVAVTGSMGKTTAKDAIAHVLSSRFRVLKSVGNFNNHFGLPLNLLKLESEHEIAVFEMGMNHAGEIAALAHLGQPNIGVVTCVAPVHLEFFDSIAGIARAKYELIEALPKGGAAVLNADDEYVSQFGRDFHGKVISFGTAPNADVRAENIELLGNQGSRFELVVGSCRETVQLPLIGRHNVMNALAAVAVGMERGLSPSEAAAALASLSAGDKRGEVVHLGGATIIVDCYNSNPRALDAMVDTLVSMPGQRHIAVAGEMLELGPTAPELHAECGRHIANAKVGMLIGVRGEARHMVEAAQALGANARFVESPEEAAEVLARELCPGDVVLLKASRGVRLERALHILQQRLAPQ